MTSRIWRIATRSSRLALWQANHVADLIRAAITGSQIELVLMNSTGDIVRDRPLYEIGSVGTFTKEIQDAVLNNTADIAVHSLKDLPTDPHPDLTLAAVPERGPIGDALVSPAYASLANLPSGARVATSSLRRKAQLLKARPDLQILDIRGNVETRIAKAKEGGLEAIVLAVAGLERLGLGSEIAETISTGQMLPAIGQGALGIECRKSDSEAQQILSSLNHFTTRACIEAERAFLRRLRGGCHAPVGALTTISGANLTLEGIVLEKDGSKWVAGKKTGRVDQPMTLGESLAEELIGRGADKLLAK